MRERIELLYEDLNTLVNIAIAQPSLAARAAAKAQRLRRELTDIRLRLEYQKTQANGLN